MLESVALFFALLSQAPVGVGDWIRLTTEQTPPSGVIRVDYRQVPPLEVCEEVAFPSSGLDYISESQFTLILEVVVSRGGRIERFRLANAPPGWNKNLNAPIQAALGKWRYRTTEPKPSTDALGFAVTLSKRGGARTTENCARMRSPLPSNKRLHPTAAE